MHYEPHLNDKIKKLNYLNSIDNKEIEYDPNLNNSQIEQFEILKQLIKNKNNNIDQSSIIKTSTSSIKITKTDSNIAENPNLEQHTPITNNTNQE